MNTLESIRRVTLSGLLLAAIGFAVSPFFDEGVSGKQTFFQVVGVLFGAILLNGVITYLFRRNTR